MEQFTSPDLTKRIYIVDNGVAISSPPEVEEFKEFEEVKEIVKALLKHTSFTSSYLPLPPFYYL